MTGHLVVEGLTTGYHRPIPAIEGIALSLVPGSIAAVIGPNGAGKTTLLNTISGLLRSWSGSVSLDGKLITGLRMDEVVRNGVVQVPEGRRILPGLTVEENLMMGAYTVRDPQTIREQIELVTDLFPILRTRRRQPGGTLSGGEQQMLAIGRALMSRPRYLLLDEPSMGLAPVIVERIFELITQLKERGLGMLLVEQNARQALAIADHGHVLEEGRIRLSGSAAALLGDPRIRESYLAVV